jgi:hypothetical protein
MTVVLRPLAPSALAKVHGKYRDAPLLEALEATHREELNLSLLSGDPEKPSLPKGTVTTERRLRYR